MAKSFNPIESKVAKKSCRVVGEHAFDATQLFLDFNAPMLPKKLVFNCTYWKEFHQKYQRATPQEKIKLEAWVRQGDHGDLIAEWVKHPLADNFDDGIADISKFVIPT